KTVRRPCGSRLVVTTPAGLWKRKSRVRSIAGIGVPSSSILSRGPTLKAGEASTVPLTRTRPAAISASASRREDMPARASRLAMRSPSSLWGGSASPGPDFGRPEDRLRAGAEVENFFLLPPAPSPRPPHPERAEEGDVGRRPNFFSLSSMWRSPFRSSSYQVDKTLARRIRGRLQRTGHMEIALEEAHAA